MDDLLLIGAGGHARSCIDVVEAEGKFQIFGLIGSSGELGSQVLGYDVLGSDELLVKLVASVNSALITIGQVKVSAVRKELFLEAQRIGYKFPRVVSPTAYVSPHAEIGEGTVVMNHATVNAGAKIGRNCIINSAALIEHDVVINDHCHVSTRVTINGGSEIGESSFIGSGATIRELVRVSAMSMVSMGTLIRSDILPSSAQDPE